MGLQRIDGTLGKGGHRGLGEGVLAGMGSSQGDSAWILKNPRPATVQGSCHCPQGWRDRRSRWGLTVWDRCSPCPPWEVATHSFPASSHPTGCGLPLCRLDIWKPESQGAHTVLSRRSNVAPPPPLL